MSNLPLSHKTIFERWTHNNKERGGVQTPGNNPPRLTASNTDVLRLHAVMCPSHATAKSIVWDGLDNHAHLKDNLTDVFCFLHQRQFWVLDSSETKRLNIPLLSWEGTMQPNPSFQVSGGITAEKQQNTADLYYKREEINSYEYFGSNVRLQ